MKKLYHLISFVFFVTALVHTTSSAYSQCTVAYASANTISAYNAGHTFVYGQSFVAECSGDMKNFNLTSSASGLINAGNINVYDGNTVTGTPIYTQSFPAMQITSGDPIVFSITGSLPLVESNQYTFVFDFNEVNFLFDPSGTYTGGTVWQDGNEGVNADFIFSVFIMNTSTNIESNLSGEYSLYPNPANNNFQITGLSGAEDFKIYNVLGAEVKKGRINNNETTDITDLKRGLYYFKITDLKTLKLIKE